MGIPRMKLPSRYFAVFYAKELRLRQFPITIEQDEVIERAMWLARCSCWAKLILVE